VPDRQPLGGRQRRQRATGREPDDDRRPAGRGEQHVEVLDLAADVVRRGVGAVAAAAPVVVEHREVRRQPLGDRHVGHPVARGAGDQHQCRPRAELVEGEGGAVR
jgi:hypothetical protein